VHKGKQNCRTNLVVISSNPQKSTSDLKKLGAPCTHLQHYKKPEKKIKKKSRAKEKKTQSKV
jgi:hypothetical protein